MFLNELIFLLNESGLLLYQTFLFLDERLPATVVEELQKRLHKITVKTRYESGTAPVLIRFRPTGLIEAGADPFYFRAMQAW